MNVFADSDAFIALVKKDDSNHKKAINLLNRLHSLGEVIFYTSNFVFSESITVISQRVGRSQAIEYISNIKNPHSIYNMYSINEEIENLAIEIFKSQRSKNTSFVDCTNIALIRKNKLDTIFSFDEVYGKNGIKYIEELL